MATKKIFFAGFGGQGILLIGQMLAYAAMLEGKEVTWMPSYGPEMRGGTANCTVIISDSKIASPIITKTDVLVAMNMPSLEKFEKMVSHDGQIFVNKSIIDTVGNKSDSKKTFIECSEIARNELKNEKVSNMVMLGAIIRKTEVISMNSMEIVLEKVFTGKKSNLIPLNLQALNSWKA